MRRRGENIHKTQGWSVGRSIHQSAHTGRQNPVGLRLWRSYADVKRVLIQKKAEAGFYNLKRTDLTFEVLAEVWLHSLRNSIKESTYAHYSYTLHKYLLPVLSKVPLRPLTRAFWNRPCSRSSRPQMPRTSHWETLLPGNASLCCAASANMPHIYV
mgnify:CR=1 FL=1